MPDAPCDQARSEATRLMARMVWPHLRPREQWLLRTCSEAPSRREPLVELAHHYRDNCMAQCLRRHCPA